MDHIPHSSVCHRQDIHQIRTTFSLALFRHLHLGSNHLAYPLGVRSLSVGSHNRPQDRQHLHIMTILSLSQRRIASRLKVTTTTRKPSPQQVQLSREHKHLLEGTHRLHLAPCKALNSTRWSCQRGTTDAQANNPSQPQNPVRGTAQNVA
ncbi:uncharacterized protein HMPREF1541_05466 [Cyphellophora europaea CBS 101466]|uniref:Uncharacterized protein n=1 Tax=Cyphellophora europaea (strain CBS 101466) TaxID=1220924 RepID=W2RTZ6_CYPE1|nr:uncharacterized protein HMPREF1541_05466 [Cyphellophora europaea CBS 101466]ETN39243.1 hypothetical protein HMPREF1541_05466 [Cyphellophora europaea CBS 101466]